MPATGNVIRWGKESARAAPWRADGAVALLVPVPDVPALSVEFVSRCLQQLAFQGYERVVTGALSPHEQPGFLEAGFVVHERLHLLLLDLSRGAPPVPAGPSLHRAGPRRRRQLLSVDASAFSPFWRLDITGLNEALHATTYHRLRVVLGERREVCAYGIFGSAGTRGFVQRLAVAPEAQRRGIGRRLLFDGLNWLATRGARTVAVNTQEGNTGALALYRSAGFREDPAGLTVLTATLPAVAQARRS